MNLFAKNPGEAYRFLAPAQKRLETISGIINGNPAFQNARNANGLIALEGISEADRGSLSTIAADLETSLRMCMEELGYRDIPQSSYDAGIMAGLIAADPRLFFSAERRPLGVATETMTIVPSLSLDATERRIPAFEAYDERDNRSAQRNAIDYNMQGCQQDEFNETFYPTTVIDPQQVGFDVTVRLLFVIEDFKRNITGAVDNFNRKNLIRAVADPTILQNEGTRIYPVARAQALGMFVRAGAIPARTIINENESIVTAPLKFGAKFSLLGISQTETLLANGTMDVSDTIDTNPVLESIYIRVGGVGGETPRIGDILKFNVTNIPMSNFVYSVQGNYRNMLLNFTTTSLLINKNTKCNDGSALIDLAGVVTGDLIVRLTINVTGSVNIETAETVVYGNPITVASVQNAASELLDLTEQPAKAIVDLFAGAEPLGYDLKAYRTNINRRERGQLINSTEVTQRYGLNLLSPITSPRPVSSDGQTDASDLTCLIAATRIRTMNAGVGALIRHANMLSEYVDARDSTGVGPEVMGVGRHFVKPSYFYEAIDVSQGLNSISTNERIADIQAFLTNKCRDYVYRMYRDSEFKAAADAIAGGVSPTPTVIIGTDPVISRYLCVNGDLRFLGTSEFNVRIVNTLDIRVKGKIFITFTMADQNSGGQIHPLCFGNMAWSPELTVVLPMQRNGQISRELTVQPRFAHINHLPILTVLSVSGISDTLDAIPLTVRAPAADPVFTDTP